MKISYIGIKACIGILIGLILLSYVVYWKSVTSLTRHMSLMVDVSNHLENGDVFHSAVHSMMMDVETNVGTARYIEDRNKADKVLAELQAYLDNHEDASMALENVLQTTRDMARAYEAFRKATEARLDEGRVEHSTGTQAYIQGLFDRIFSEYRKLHRHHAHQKKEIVDKTHAIRKSIDLIFFVQLTLALLAGTLVILYFDRVVLKVFGVTENLALHDRLTGLYNRHALDRFINELGRSKEKRDKGYGLILLDIDHFKMFNDTYGHAAGDLLLKKLASLLTQVVRQQDKIIRLGGEEILILLSWVDIAGTRKVAEKVRCSVAFAPFDLKDGLEAKRATVSIGYAASTYDRGSFEELLQIADRRLYDAKKHGRNRIAGP